MQTFIKLLENKDRFIDKNVNLSNTQKKEMKKFFRSNRQAEKKVNWQQSKTMSYDEFLDVKLMFRSGRKSTKNMRCHTKNIKGLKNGVDYINIKMKTKEFCAYIPLSYETAQKFNRNDYIGTCSGDWCIGSTIADYEWKSHVILKKEVPIYVVNATNKWVVMIQKGNNSFDVWDEDNSNRDSFIDLDVKKHLMTSKLKSLYNEARDIIKTNTLFPLWFREADKRNEVIDVDDSGNVIWRNGIWIDGVAKFYTWDKGIWLDGDWHGGTWYNGRWESGTHHNGYWFEGTWVNGVWKSGTWYGGIWEDGIWESGIWEDGIWKGGTWKKGTWKGGYDDKGNHHKTAPPLWGEEKTTNKFFEYFELVDKQKGLELELFEEMGDTVSILIYMASRGELRSLNKNKMLIQVRSKDNISLSNANVDINRKSPFKKDFSIDFKMCDVFGIIIDDKDRTASFEACNIYSCQITYDKSQIISDSIIYGGYFDVTKLADYAVDFSAFGVFVHGGAFENKGQQRITLKCNPKEAGFTNIIPEGNIFTSCFFDNCLINTDKIGNMKDCKFISCDITNREAFNKYTNNTVVD